MKSALFLLTSPAMIATALAPSSTKKLQNDLPNVNFRTDLIFDSPILPIKSTFANIAYFMRKVALSGFEEQLQPLTDSSPLYPEIEIKSYATTEARFLLWGIYLTAADMVKYTRFNDVVAKLYWHNKFVGQISLLVKTNLRLPGPIVNATGRMTDGSKELSSDDISNKTSQASTKTLNAPRVDKNTSIDTAEKAMNMISVKAQNITSGNPSASPTQRPLNAPLSSRITVDFIGAASATRLNRNDVFLTFYAALLHVARYPASDRLQYFDTKIPKVDMGVHMYEMENECLVVLSVSARFPLK